MPDWRNPEDYAYCQGISWHDWAWEFLRRNPAYARAWRACQEAQAAIAAAPECDRQAAVDSRDREYRAVGDTWGLARPLDPTFSSLKATPYWLHAVGVAIISHYSVSQWEGWPGYPSDVGLRFDFSQPIEQQLRHAAQILGRFAQRLEDDGITLVPAKPKIKASVRRFTLYLRLLDAEAEGVGFGEMGRVLLPETEDKIRSAKGALRHARMMTEHGYRDLLLMAAR